MILFDGLVNVSRMRYLLVLVGPLSMYNGPEQACRRDTYAAGLKRSPVSVKGTHHLQSVKGTHHLQQARCLGDRREPTNVIGSRPHEH